MQVYTGKSVSGQQEKNQGMRVVLDVTKGLRGHTVFPGAAKEEAYNGQNH